MTVADQLEIRDLVAGYCHACDDADASAVAALFTSDADYVVGERIVTGRQAIEAHFVSVAGTASIGKHLTTNTIVALADEDDASGVSDWAYLVGSPSGLVPLAAGRYLDRYRRGPEGWRIARREILVYETPGS